MNTIRDMTEIENKLVLCPKCFNYKPERDFIIQKHERNEMMRYHRILWWAKCRRCRANDN